MNDVDDANFDSLQERAWDSASETQRARLRDEVATLPETQRVEMEAVMEDVDRLRGTMGKNVSISTTLKEKLLAIPANTPQPNWLMRAARAPVGWQHLAACLLIGIGIALYAYWPEPRLSTLDAQVASHVATWAAKYHGSATPLDLASDDRAKVEAALAAKHLPFTPTLLQPVQPVKLAGEGIVDLEGHPAAFTRWTNDQGKTFTLYQFEPKRLGMPKAFLQSVANASGNLRVVMWPGPDGTCSWALVLESGATNPFSYSY